MLETGKRGDRFREAGAPDHPGPLDFCVSEMGSDWKMEPWRTGHRRTEYPPEDFSGRMM